jgi:hypothetical protein
MALDVVVPAFGPNLDSVVLPRSHAMSLVLRSCEPCFRFYPGAGNQAGKSAPI